MSEHRHIQPYLCDIIGLLWYLVALGWKNFEHEAMCIAFMALGTVCILYGLVARILNAIDA